MAARMEGRLGAAIAAAREVRLIATFEPRARDLNDEQSGAVRVTALTLLEDFLQATQRSVAAAVESALGPRSDDAPCVVDDAASARISWGCARRSAGLVRASLDEADRKGRLQQELQQTATQPAGVAGAARRGTHRRQLGHDSTPAATSPLPHRVTGIGASGQGHGQLLSSSETPQTRIMGGRRC